MSDLERFLQQAAERMKQRMEGQGQAPQSAQQALPKAQGKQPKQVPVRQAERADSTYAEVEELVEAEIVEQPSVQSSGKKFGNVSKRKPPVTSGVDQADERMAQRLQQKFDHSVGQIQQKAASRPAFSEARAEQTNQAQEVQRRQDSVSPLISMLRDPDSLKAAFIVSEIFRRKFE